MSSVVTSGSQFGRGLSKASLKMLKYQNLAVANVTFDNLETPMIRFVFTVTVTTYQTMYTVFAVISTGQFLSSNEKVLFKD